LVYYSDETVNFSAQHLHLLLTYFNEVRLIKVSELRPGLDCEYWQEAHMVVPVARNMVSSKR
jgi:hypothetical protein